jgi:hypothetical protein
MKPWMEPEQSQAGFDRSLRIRVGSKKGTASLVVTRILKRDATLSLSHGLLHVLRLSQPLWKVESLLLEATYQAVRMQSCLSRVTCYRHFLSPARPLSSTLGACGSKCARRSIVMFLNGGEQVK